MDSIAVTGGQRLEGSVSVSGSKNAALPVLFAALLADGEHRFDNVPALRDIDSTEQLLRSLNCETSHVGHELSVNVARPETCLPSR